MFAVMKTGGKQYKVVKNDVLVVERLAAEAGETVQFNHILMIGGDEMMLGDPTVEGAAVQAEVVEQGRGPKVLNLKRRRRKHGSRRLKGHRQYLTTVRVTDILSSGCEATNIRAAVGTGSAGGASSPTTAAETQAAPETHAATEASDAGTRPTNLLSEAEGKPDDLTRISGIGPKLLEKMNQNGVFHFWQIASWGPDEIAYMDAQLNFKGRIEREDWIDQAKAFAAETGE